MCATCGGRAFRRFRHVKKLKVARALAMADAAASSTRSSVIALRGSVSGAVTLSSPCLLSPSGAG